MNPSNYTSISFPTLGLEVNPGRSIALGNFNIYYYGLVIALGLLLAVMYACKRSKEFGLKEDDILFNGASTGLTGELQIIFCDDDFEWINAVPIDYASSHFWKKSCDGWNCTWNP